MINDQRIVWLNLSGSGNETAAHLLAQPRMTLMFCSFSDKPMILRVYGTAQAIHSRDDAWNDEIKRFPQLAGSRQVFVLDIDLVQTSCGTGVPVMNFERTRADTDLVPFFADMGEDGVQRYWRKKNSKSIDGMPTGIELDERELN